MEEVEEEARHIISSSPLCSGYRSADQQVSVTVLEYPERTHCPTVSPDSLSRFLEIRVQSLYLL